MSTTTSSRQSQSLSEIDILQHHRLHHGSRAIKQSCKRLFACLALYFNGQKLVKPFARRLDKVRCYWAMTMLFFCLTAKAQQNTGTFLEQFNAASVEQKVNLVATNDFGAIVEFYPLIKDTLSKIRTRTYTSSSGNHQRYLFDKLDANIETYHNNYARAIIILENCLRHHAANIDDSLRCLVDLKNLFIHIKNYNKAIDLCYSIEKKWTRKTDSVRINYGMGKSSIYNQLGLTEKAIVERKKEFKIMKNSNDTVELVSFYNDIGVFYNSIKQSDSAEVYLLKAKSLLGKIIYPPEKETELNFFKSLIDGNLGLAYYNTGRTKEAIPLLKKDIYYSNRSANFESALNSYLLLTRIHLDLKENQLAHLYLDSSKVLVDTKIKEARAKLRFLLIQAEYYSITGNLQKANDSYRNYLELDKQANALNNAQEQKNENISLNVEQKEAELAEKDDLLKAAQLKEARQKFFQAYLFAGILILLAIVAFLIHNNSSSKKREAQLSMKNQQISLQKQVIEQALKDKEILIKEIHHRVKNNLQIITSMLSLQIAKVDDDKSGLILRDARQRISSIALTHQMLYQKENLSDINLGEYVEKLVRQVEQLMPASNIKLITEISAAGSRLTIDNAVPLGLLINELLTNAYKHAFPENAAGRITVALSEDDAIFTLTISDNGVGLPENFDAFDKKTLGIELIYILADQLDLQLSIDKNQGSAFILKIKKTF